MSDEKKFEPIRDPNNEPVKFVNEVAGSGHLNGVVNLTFSVANFTPGNDEEVHIDRVIASRLRMDLYCAATLRDALDKIIEAATKGPAQPKAQLAEGIGGKPN